MADGRLYTKGELVLSIFLCKRLGALLAIFFFLNFLRVLSSLVVSLGTAPNTCKPKVSCQGRGAYLADVGSGCSLVRYPELRGKGCR